MRCLAALLAIVCLTHNTAEARPRRLDISRPSISVDPYIIGGMDAEEAEFPWQLSLQMMSKTWSHICGASLLSSTKALTAAHCFDGILRCNLQIVAGLHILSDKSKSQTRAVASYLAHEDYGIGAWTYPNDIGIITLNSSVNMASNVGLLTLPPDDINQFVGATCVLSGWGRASANSSLSDVLQKVPIPVISNKQCNTNMSHVPDTICDVSQIAVYDSSDSKGSCSGDSGGPMNCPDVVDGERNATVVAGLTSWGIFTDGICNTSYPSVYTRTSFYLEWIEQHKHD